jgi:GNAT superfamily N-acetyltransferase
MKLYRHYKNKAYTYIGIAKHSESLDEMVVYETRYQNDLGKLWVRPRQMFEEDVLIAGKMQPRFAKISLSISAQTSVSESDFHFISANAQKFNFLMNSGFALGALGLLLKAQIDDDIVGFSWGLARELACFECSPSGVLPEYQGLGIEKDLIAFAQDWCRRQNFKKIRSKILNQNKAALVLSLEDGFEICGTEGIDPNRLKIILEKKL